MQKACQICYHWAFGVWQNHWHKFFLHYSDDLRVCLDHSVVTILHFLACFHSVGENIGVWDHHFVCCTFVMKFDVDIMILEATCAAHFIIFIILYGHIISSRVLILCMVRDLWETFCLYMCGTVVPSEPWPPSKVAFIHLYPQLVFFILIFMGSVMHPSGQCPPILFLVFLLVLCCGISH